MKISQIISWFKYVFCFIFVAYGIQSTQHVFSLQMSQWNQGASMPTARSEIAATLFDKRIYVAGGIHLWGTTDAFEAYDIERNTWDTLKDLPTPIHHASLVTLDRKIFIIGGYDDLKFTPLKSTWIYDSQKDQWDKGTDLPFTRAAHVAVSLKDKIYIIGGSGPEPGTILIYDPKINRWEKGPSPMPHLREHLTAIVLNNKIYVIGGRWKGKNLAIVEVYDPATGRWESKQSLTIPRSGFTAGILKGHIHVFGGESTKSGTIIQSHEFYDLQENTWSNLPKISEARHGMASITYNSKWYIIGGATRAGNATLFSASDSVDIFHTQE